ncbi:MAG: F0F1 ATP synthase subunit B [Eggerthellaceae bacterium]|nr:F0F1 ATP synthase subunit B [Eggerthellaceae bacterium]
MKAGAHKATALLGTMTVAVMTAFPTLAFADDGDVETGGISAIIPDPIEFIPMLIAFIILWIILAKFGWPMFNGMLEKRENTIRDALQQSEDNKIESERVLEEYKKQLADAKAQSAQILTDARAAGENVMAEMNAKAQKEAEDLIAKARVSIEAERNQAQADLQSSVADISIAVASKIIGQDLSDAEHRKIIERYVKEAGSLNAN